MLFADGSFCAVPFCTPTPRTWNLDVSETAEGTDSVANIATLVAAINETAEAQDTVANIATLVANIADTAVRKPSRLL
jgi:hypothetical protein